MARFVAWCVLLIFLFCCPVFIVPAMILWALVTLVRGKK